MHNHQMLTQLRMGDFSINELQYILNQLFLWANDIERHQTKWMFDRAVEDEIRRRTREVADRLSEAGNLLRKPILSKEDRETVEFILRTAEFQFELLAVQAQFQRLL